MSPAISDVDEDQLVRRDNLRMRDDLHQNSSAPGDSEAAFIEAAAERG